MMKKINLYKYTPKLLLKNDAQLKQKCGKKPAKKKNNHPNLLKKKNHAKEKS